MLRSFDTFPFSKTEVLPPQLSHSKRWLLRVSLCVWGALQSWLDVAGLHKGSCFFAQGLCTASGSAARALNHSLTVWVWPQPMFDPSRLWQGRCLASLGFLGACLVHRRLIARSGREHGLPSARKMVQNLAVQCILLCNSLGSDVRDLEGSRKALTGVVCQVAGCTPPQVGPAARFDKVLL